MQRRGERAPLCFCIELKLIRCLVNRATSPRSARKRRQPTLLSATSALSDRVFAKRKLTDVSDRCQQTGHIARNCTSAEAQVTGVTSAPAAGGKSSKACYTCGKHGHTSANCYHNQNKQNTARNAAGKVIKCYSCGGLNQYVLPFELEKIVWLTVAFSAPLPRAWRHRQKVPQAAAARQSPAIIARSPAISPATVRMKDWNARSRSVLPRHAAIAVPSLSKHIPRCMWCCRLICL